MKRPVSIYILAFLSFLNVLQSIYHTLQFAGLSPFKLFNGSYEYEDGGFGWVTIAISGIFVLIWIYLTWKILMLDQSAYNILVILTGLHFFIFIILLLLQVSWQELASTIITDILILVLCALPSTRKAIIKPRGWGQ
jgi:hypothetical protein